MLHVHTCVNYPTFLLVSAKIIEHYQKSYGDIIGGVIGGVIALGLIIAFGVWVAWRYRQEYVAGVVYFVININV